MSISTHKRKEAEALCMLPFLFPPCLLEAVLVCLEETFPPEGRVVRCGVAMATTVQNSGVGMGESD